MTTCTHNLPGFCWDDATPEQRADFDFGYRHAYDYASGGMADHSDEAEAYAHWYMARHFVDSLADLPSHRDAWLRYLESLAPVVVRPESGAGRRIDAAKRAKVRAQERAAAKKAQRAADKWSAERYEQDVAYAQDLDYANTEE